MRAAGKIDRPAVEVHQKLLQILRHDVDDVLRQRFRRRIRPRPRDRVLQRLHVAPPLLRDAPQKRRRIVRRLRFYRLRKILPRHIHRRRRPDVRAVRHRRDMPRRRNERPRRRRMSPRRRNVHDDGDRRIQDSLHHAPSRVVQPARRIQPYHHEPRASRRRLIHDPLQEPSSRRLNRLANLHHDGVMPVGVHHRRPMPHSRPSEPDGYQRKRQDSPHDLPSTFPRGAQSQLDRSLRNPPAPHRSDSVILPNTAPQFNTALPYRFLLRHGLRPGQRNPRFRSVPFADARRVWYDDRPCPRNTRPRTQTSGCAAHPAGPSCRPEARTATHAARGQQERGRAAASRAEPMCRTKTHPATDAARATSAAVDIPSGGSAS